MNNFFIGICPPNKILQTKLLFALLRMYFVNNSIDFLRKKFTFIIIVRK